MTDQPNTPDIPADDDLIARMRGALDEAARIEPGTAKPSPAPDRRRWLAVAAAAVLVIGGVAAIAVNRGNDASDVAGPVPTSTGTTDPTTTTGLPIGGGWYEIAAPGLTARPPEFTVCCPPMPAPGPDVVMVWTDGNGGLLMLQAIGHVDGGSLELKYAHYGMSDDRAKELEAKVVPGSGLPYVLDDPNMELLGQGFDGIGTSVSQRYIPNAGDGDVVLTVGDYTGQLAALAGPFPVEQTTIAGQPGVRYATNSSVVFVWQTPDATWAQLSISSALASRADEIVASLIRAPLPIDSTTSTTVDTKPTNTITAPVDDVVYMGNVGGIIDSGDGRGPMLTFFWLDSYPPQGGTLPLENFDWSMVDGEQTANGTTWLDETIGVTGTFDGTTFTLTEPPSSPFTFTDDVLTYGTLTEGCTDADVAPALAALNAIDHVALGLIESSDYRWDGHCGVQLAAMFDSEGLRNAIATLGDDVMVRIAFHPVQP